MPRGLHEGHCISCGKSGALLTSRIRTGTIFSRNGQKLPPVGGGTEANALVDSTMLYGVEIWGCRRSLETIEQVQLCAFRMLFGVSTLHPKASLMIWRWSSASSVGGKREVCAVLIQGIDK